MGIRDTLELGSPRRQLSRRSRSSSLDSFSEELLGLSGGSLEYQNELCPDRQYVYSPKGKNFLQQEIKEEYQNKFLVNFCDF